MMAASLAVIWRSCFWFVLTCTIASIGVPLLADSPATKPGEIWVPTVNEKGERGWIDLKPLIWSEPTEPGEPDDSEWVPDGYVRSYTEEFNDPLTVVDIPAAKQGDEWIGAFKAWNVRNLAGNADKGGKVVTGDTQVFNGDSHSIRSVNKPVTAQSGGRLQTFQFTAGMISTETGHRQLYGYYEFRMRADLSKGHHVAAWLLMDDGSYNKAAEVCEVDMVEALGQDDKLYFNDHGPGTSPMTQLAGGKVQDWHVYGLAWTASGMVWTLDGKEVRRSSKSMPRKAYWLLSLEIGGNWPGLPNASTVWPANVEIDYLRIYKKAA